MPVKPSVSSSHALAGTTILLVLVNLLPLAGVLFWDWSVYVIVLLFWAENVIVGAFNVARFWVLWRYRNDSKMVLFIPFFCFHFGLFTLVHLGFVIALFAPDHGPVLPLGLLAVPFLALVLSHAVSFFTHFIGQGEYKQATPEELMAQPYARVLALQVVIIAGGFLVGWMGSPISALLLLVVAKIAIDVGTHRREHRRKLEQLRRASAPAGHDPDFPRWVDDDSGSDVLSPEQALEHLPEPAALLAAGAVDLEGLRQRHARWRDQARAELIWMTGVGLVLAILVGWLTPMPVMLALLMGVILTLGLAFFRLDRKRARWQTHIHEQVLPELCEHIAGLASVGYLNREFLRPFEKLGLVGDHWNRSRYGPHLRGRHRGLAFEFGSVVLSHRSGGKNSSTETVFQGLLLRFRLPADVLAPVVVSGKSLLSGRRHMVAVDLGDPAFDDKLSVHVAQDAADPQALGQALLSAEWRAALLSLPNLEGEEDGRQVHFQAAFYQDSLYLALVRIGSQRPGPAGIVIQRPGRDFFALPLTIFLQPGLEEAALQLLEDACVGQRVAERLPIA